MGENARARRAGALRGRQADAGLPGDSQMTGSEIDDLPVHLDAGNVRGNLADWIQTHPVDSQIRRTFAHFLETCAPMPASCVHISMASKRHAAAACTFETLSPSRVPALLMGPVCMPPAALPCPTLPCEQCC